MTVLEKKQRQPGKILNVYCREFQPLKIATVGRRLCENSSLVHLGFKYIESLPAAQTPIPTIEQVVELMRKICVEYLARFLANTSSTIAKQIKILTETIDIIRQEQVQSKLSEIMRGSGYSMSALINAFELVCIDMRHETHSRILACKNQTFYYSLGVQFRKYDLKCPSTRQARRLFDILILIIRRENYELAKTLSELNSEHIYSVSRLMRAGQNESNILFDDMRLPSVADTTSIDSSNRCVG